MGWQLRELEFAVTRVDNDKAVRAARVVPRRHGRDRRRRNAGPLCRRLICVERVRAVGAAMRDEPQRARAAYEDALMQTCCVLACTRTCAEAGADAGEGHHERVRVDVAARAALVPAQQRSRCDCRVLPGSGRHSQCWSPRPRARGWSPTWTRGLANDCISARLASVKAQQRARYTEQR